jgi:hypothetical protein
MSTRGEQIARSHDAAALWLREHAPKQDNPARMVPTETSGASAASEDEPSSADAETKGVARCNI